MFHPAHTVSTFAPITKSWRILDLSIAMAYAMMSNYGKNHKAISAASAILRGFHSLYPLTSQERKHLRLLIASRLSCSATLGAYSIQQNPDNEYLLLHAEPAWKTLELLCNVDYRGVIDSMFDVACDGDGDGSVIGHADISFPDPCIPDPLHSARSCTVTATSTISEPPRKKCKVILSNENSIITFVTGNKKKLEEVVRILSKSNESSSPLAFSISNQKIDLPELQGDPLEIAKEKCALAAKEVMGPVITEDTSLCFTALKDMPGPYIKWFLEKCGHEGLNDMIAFSEDKSGYAQTVVGFCPGPGQEVVVFDGRTRGIVVPARGSLDFGWDPIFQPDEGDGFTYAEMSKGAKDSISHRSRAFGKLRSYLEAEADSIKLAIAKGSQ